jgi:acetylornithine deacetylase
MQLTKDDIARAVADRREWAVEALSEFVRQPTVLGSEEGGQRVAAKLFEELELEVKVETIKLADIEGKPGFSPVDWQLDGKHNVVGIHEGGNGRSLIFNGHVDVVSPEPTKLWSSPPFEPRVVNEDGETWMYGRGAGDMKGGTVSYLWALNALRDLGRAPAGKVICQSVVEEECTGNGALSLLEKGYRADAAIIPEPFNETIITAQVGVLWFRVRVLGETTHVLGAGKGVNAIEKSWPIIQALRDLEEEVNREVPEPYQGVEHPLNLNVGTINGGDWQSTVAGECVTGFRFGAFPGDSLDKVKQVIEDRVAHAATADPWLKGNPPQVEWVGFQAEGCVFDAESEFGKSLRNAHKQWRDTEPEQLRCTATTDIRFFNLYYDIPATCYGPKAERIHGVDERVSIDSMQRVTEVMCSFVQDWCGLK